MGIFSRFFQKQGVVWPQFVGKQNSRALLREKALALSPVLIRSAADWPERMEEYRPNSPTGRVLFESIVLHLHLVDRFAFSLFGGSEDRGWFMTSLYDDVVGRLGASLCKNESEVSEASAAFRDLYNSRMASYAACEVLAENPHSSVGWKYAEVLGLPESFENYLAVVYTVGDLYTRLRDNLELLELLVGYENVKRKG